MKPKCVVCGCNPTPITVNGIEIRPCGKSLKGGLILTENQVFDCPMWQWQSGYIACLKTIHTGSQPAEK